MLKKIDFYKIENYSHIQYNKKKLMQTLEKIGEGGSSEVMKCQIDDKIYALKVFKPQYPEQLRVKEIQILMQLQHPNIVKVIKTDAQHSFIVLEYLKNDLFNLVNAKKSLKVKTVKYILFSLGKTLSFMHKLGYVHRDIKLENCMIDEEGVIKIVDFGMSTLCIEGSQCGRLQGTQTYMAPELYKDDKKIWKTQLFSTDVFALGVLIFICLYGFPPISIAQQDKCKLWNLIVQQKWNVFWSVIDRKEQKSDQQFRQLIEQMLDPDPKKRPTMDDMGTSLKMSLSKTDKITTFRKKIIQQKITFKKIKNNKIKKMNNIIIDGTDFKISKVNIDGIEYALKQAKARKDIQTISEEIKIIQLIPPHKNIVQLIDCDPSKGWMRFELLHKDLFQAAIDQKLSFDQIAKYMVQMIEGLGHLHNNGIVHRDIKLENLMLDFDDNIKLIDFGQSAQLSKQEVLRNQGSLYTQAPEIINGFGFVISTKSLPKADIYSLGVVLFTLIFQTYPYQKKNHPWYFMKEEQWDSFWAYHSRSRKDIPEPLKELLEGLLNHDPAKRFTLTQAKNCQFLNIYNYLQFC
ncbi:hypothetical protein pb186bvf_007783 [Paramecium bursaria]